MIRTQNRFSRDNDRGRDRDEGRFGGGTGGRGGKGKGPMGKGRGRGSARPPRKPLAKFIVPKDVNFDYKNLPLLQRFLNDRGKMLPRRITGITARDQRKLNRAVRRARFLALLPTGGVK